MIGAIISDIVGSRFEFENIKSKNFEMFAKGCRPTDDSLMTIALGKAIILSDAGFASLEKCATVCMQEFGRTYFDAGYGNMFFNWLLSKNPRPYNSFGNGAAMRVSGAGFAARSLEEAKEIAYKITAVTHNHPEGLKGATAVATAIYLARQKADKDEIKRYICDNYYDIHFTLDEIRNSYEFNETCQGSVPQALEAFFESNDFEDAIRNAISIGGDSDTIGAITGGIAEAYYGVPAQLRTAAESYLNNQKYSLPLSWLKRFEEQYPA